MDDPVYTVIEDPNYGYKRLEPIPGPGEINEFYQSRYYDLIRTGGRSSRNTEIDGWGRRGGERTRLVTSHIVFRYARYC